MIAGPRPVEITCLTGFHIERYLWKKCGVIMRPTVCILAGFLVWISFPTEAFAYIDPGTGTFVLQILAAAAVGILFYIRRIVDRAKKFFLPGREDEPRSDDVTD